MKRARVAVAVTVTGLAAVLGISLLTPSGGATPALPARVSDNPVDYTPIISGNACLSDDTADGTCRRVRDITRIGDSVYVGGIIDSVTDRTNGAVRTVGNAMMLVSLVGCAASFPVCPPHPASNAAAPIRKVGRGSIAAP